MAIITYPLNNIEYTAEDAELYHATRTSGVFANDDFPITVSGDGNTVTIGEGIGWIRNSKFSGKVVANKAEMSLDLGLPHATYPRIDAVVLQFNANANASEIIVKNGTAKTSPTPPEVVRTESIYELHLYHVYREAGAASVTASNVTDLRSDSAYCGIMSDDVTMLGDDYVRKDMVGVANGVASLGGDGKVPVAQLPPMNYIPTSQKGAASGVAPLNANKKIDNTYLPTIPTVSTSVTSTSTTTAASSSAVKQAYDKADSANERRPTALGMTITSDNTSVNLIGGVSSQVWPNMVISRLHFYALDGIGSLSLTELTISVPGLISNIVAGTAGLVVDTSRSPHKVIGTAVIDTSAKKICIKFNERWNGYATECMFSNIY